MFDQGTFLVGSSMQIILFHYLTIVLEFTAGGHGSILCAFLPKTSWNLCNLNNFFSFLFMKEILLKAVRFTPEISIYM